MSLMVVIFPCLVRNFIIFPQHAAADMSGGQPSAFQRRPTVLARITPGQPGLQFGDRPGEVHGTLRAQCPSGSGLGAGPSFTWLLGAHPTPVGLSRRQWRSRRLRPTCKEAGEARVDVLGRDLGAAETGACSASSAGKAETQTQSGSGCRAWLMRAGWLERGPDRCSRVRTPGGAVLYCWDGGAAKTASSENADGSPVTKVNHFYNGLL